MMMQPNGTPKSFAIAYLVFLGITGYAHARSLMRNKNSKIANDNVVIDKTGRYTGDIQTTQKLASHYKEHGLFDVIIAPILFIGIGLPLHAWPAEITSYFIARGIWQLRAEQKLLRREWTVQTKPPELKKKATAPVFSKAATGLAP
jgi:hypothetical protein